MQIEGKWEGQKNGERLRKLIKKNSKDREERTVRQNKSGNKEHIGS